MQKFSLDAIVREQAKRASAASSGRSAETVFGGHEHMLRQTVIVLTAGSALDEHENPGEATIQVLRGRVRLTAGQVAWEGRTGDFLIVPDARHALHASRIAYPGSPALPAFEIRSALPADLQTAFPAFADIGA